MNKTAAAIILSLVCAVSYQALGDEIEVKSLNRSSTGLFVFSPDFVRIMSDDAINFAASDKGHQVYSVPGMIPEGALPFYAKMSQDIKVTFTVSEVYVIACRPHMTMGMIGVVLVGDPINIDKLDPSSLPARARIKLETLLEPLPGRSSNTPGSGVPQSMQHPSSSRRQRVTSNQSRPINSAPRPWHQVLPPALSWTLPV
jgi:pseudoazurin